jgi:uncharacterized protein (TIGR02186 family)
MSAMLHPLARLAAVALLAGIGAWPQPATAESVVARLSDTRVEIRSNFVGTELLLFGLIEPDETTPEGLAASYDVAVVVRGPPLDMVARRRDRVAGIWINRESVAFEDAPSFYATLSNRPVHEIAPAETLERHQIGLGQLRLQPVEPGAPEAQRIEFREALIRNKQARHLYMEDGGAVSMMTPALFSTRIALPAHIATGGYSARILVFYEGTLVATERESFWVAKSGFEARVFNLAERRPFLYGLGAVAVALFAGWFAGVIFRRD